MVLERKILPVGLLVVSASAAASACGSGSVPDRTEIAPATEIAEVAVDEQEKAVEWGAPVLVASGAAHRGPWRMNRSDWRFVDDPTVALDAHGNAGVAWVDHTRKDVLFQLYGPDGEPRLEEPVNVSRSSTIFSWLPRMVMAEGDGGDGGPPTIHLLWQEIVFSGGSHGGEIFFARSTDGGATFSTPQNLSRTTAGAGKGRLTPDRWDNGSYDLVQGPGGELFAAWTEYEGNLWLSRSTDGGRTFSEPLHVAGGEGEPPARGPSLAALADGRVLLAWTVGEAASADIQLAASDDGGRSFGSPRPVHVRPGHADAPKLAVDGRGRVHLAYGESPDGPFRRYRVLYARADAETLDFGEPRELSAAQPGRFESVHHPNLRLDGKGHLYMTWELLPDARGRPMALGFTLSTDGGETFEPQTLVPIAGDGTAAGEAAHGFSGSQQGLLMSKLAVSPGGEIALVNSTFRPSDASRIWLLRGRAQAREAPPSSDG